MSAELLAGGVFDALGAEVGELVLGEVAGLGEVDALEAGGTFGGGALDELVGHQRSRLEKRRTCKISALEIGTTQIDTREIGKAKTRVLELSIAQIGPR